MSTQQSQLNRWGIVAIVGFMASIAGIATGVIDVYQFWNPDEKQQVSPSPLVDPQVDSAGSSSPPERARRSGTEIDITTARLKSAIDLAGQLETQALRELNPTLLHRIFVNEALKSRLANLEGLRNSGSYAVAHRHSISYGPIVINPEGNRAEVQANPVWELAFFSVLNNACLGRIAARDVPQRLYLEQRNGDWMITAIQFDEGATDTLIPC